MTPYTENLLAFLDASPVNFLAVDTISAILDGCGYTKLNAAEPIDSLLVGGKYYFTKNDSSIYAFHIGVKPMAEAGFHLICAHCDSPTFRVKPNCEMMGEGRMVKLNTEVYGGAILSTWFDRPLSLAGRVILRGQDALHPETRLLCIRRPLLTIPNLAIHFNRQVNDGVKLSKQKDMLPILGYVSNQLESEGLLIKVIADELQVDSQEILDFDLYLYDTTPACLFGLNEEFISSGRLDDLSMVCAGLEALTTDDDSTGSQSIPAVTKVLAIFDNEETGSCTKQGAGSNFLSTLLQRMVAAQGSSLEDYYCAVEKSFMISADNAHALHPNYVDKEDPTNHPLMGGGPVIKYNAAQKYASDAVSASIFKEICREAKVPCQVFVNHSDIAGGSTLGNILTGSLPIKGVDMGSPILAMHSCRETGSVLDHEYAVRAFTQFYREKA